jgi:hypothetical protein
MNVVASINFYGGRQHVQFIATNYGVRINRHIQTLRCIACRILGGRFVSAQNAASNAVHANVLTFTDALLRFAGWDFHFRQRLSDSNQYRPHIGAIEISDTAHAETVRHCQFTRIYDKTFFL